MSVSKISSSTNTYHTNNNQKNTGELRHDFRRLLESIRDGNLVDAQRAYHIIAHTLPDIFQTLSKQLTSDYKAIGDALAKDDISRARQAVVKLQQNLQSIGRTSSQPLFDINIDSTRTLRPASTSVFDSYSEKIALPTIGSNIDIMI